MLAELDATNVTTIRYLNNPQQIDEVLAYQRGSQTEFPLVDGLGSLYASTDASGNMVHRYDFDVYGKRTDLGGTSPAIDNGYTGKEHDANGLINNGLRQRNPLLGSWLQADPMGMVDGPNLYNYVGNQPTMATDPTGLFKTDFNSMNQVCGVALAGNWGRTLTFLQALQFALVSALGTGNQSIDEIAEFLVDGVGPPLVFDTGPGLINGSQYAGTKVDITNSAVSRVIVSTQAIDRGIDFLAHVLVHEAAHMQRFHHPERGPHMMSPLDVSASLNTSRENADWRSYNPVVPYEGYWAETQVFGTTNFVH